MIDATCIPVTLSESLLQYVMCLNARGRKLVETFTLDEKDYLCNVDYYSDYFEIVPLERKTPRAIVTRLKRNAISPIMVYPTCFRAKMAHLLTLRSLEILQQLKSSS